MAAHDSGAPPAEPPAAGQGAGPESASPGWADRARETFDLATQSKAVLAAVGIGSAALLAALLFTRRARKQRA
jgi:hypothetical protein